MNTPKSMRLAIGIFGRTNVGKSSVMNVLSAQNTSIVSPVAGTTTDVVQKAMEIHGLGAVVLIDTAGVDDESELGKARVDRTFEAIESVDIAILVTENLGGGLARLGAYETALIEEFRRAKKPFLIVANKCDLVCDFASNLVYDEVANGKMSAEFASGIFSGNVAGEFEAEFSSVGAVSSDEFEASGSVVRASKFKTEFDGEINREFGDKFDENSSRDLRGEIKSKTGASLNGVDNFYENLKTKNDENLSNEFSREFNDTAEKFGKNLQLNCDENSRFKNNAKIDKNLDIRNIEFSLKIENSNTEFDLKSANSDTDFVSKNLDIKFTQKSNTEFSANSNEKFGAVFDYKASEFLDANNDKNSDKFLSSKFNDKIEKFNKNLPINYDENLYAKINVKFDDTNSKTILNQSEILFVSAKTGLNFGAVFDALSKIASRISASSDDLFGGIVRAGETILLITPIDDEAPKGRLILPQVQAIRQILDIGAFACVSADSDVAKSVAKFRPNLIVCDSQCVLEVVKTAPREVKITTFSVLMSRLKGDLSEFVRGARAIERLRDGDKILIAEACSHNAKDGDIARVKIPNLLQKFTGKRLVFHYTSGKDYPRDLGEFALIIHCGGCMISKTIMQNRLNRALSHGVPITNYGVAISLCQGVLDRICEVFEGEI